MSLQPIFIHKNGFTLFEVIVVLAIFSALMLMGLFFDLTFYRGTSFNTDVDIFASILQRARARAINNINESNHGVCVDTDNFVLFEGDDCLTATVKDNISRNPGLSFSGIPAISVSGIVFSRLSGDSNFEGNIIIGGFGKTATIQLNYEGLINR